MATKTITLELDAYEKLRAAKTSPRESFSQVVRRLQVPGAKMTAGEWLALRKAGRPLMTEADARDIDAVNSSDIAPEIP